MHPVPLSSVFQHGEHSKSLADILLQRRITQAAAAFLVAAQELVGGSKALLPAVALTQPLCSALFGFDGDLAPNIPGVQISARSSSFDRVSPSSHSRSPEPYPAAECGCPTGRPRRNHKCSSRPYSRFSVPRSVPILSAFQYGSRSQFWASLILPPVQTGSSHGFARPRYK